MKTIYNSLLARLQAEVPAIEWIDQDNGQLDGGGRPPVTYPCCLIDISYPQCTSLTDDDQSVKVAIGLRLAWDVVASTAGNAPESVREAGLSPYDVVDSVHRALQGWSPDGCEPLDRTSQKKATGAAAFVYGMDYETLTED